MNLRKIAITMLATAFMAVPGIAQTKSNAHNKAHANLIASRSNSKDKIKLLEKNSFIDLYEELEPEPDIFTEGMNSRLVNPYNAATVPNSAVIDVRGFHMPTGYNRINSNYGYRARFKRMHKGIDLHIKMNDTIYAAFSGVVRLTNYEGKGYGNYVILRHGNQLETVYGHLNRFLVKKGQHVKAGQPIALGGSTGRSTGPHLHFETRYMGYAINPSAIFDFNQRTIHTDYYTFNKKTYTQPRSYSQKKEMASSKQNQSEARYQAAKTQPGTYTVKAGDDIASIARMAGLNKTKLLQLNGLKASDHLKVGQVLRIK